MQEKAAVALECAYYFFCIQNLHTKLLYARLLLFWVSCFFRKTHSLTAPLRFFRSTLLPCLRSIEPTTQNAIQFYSQFFSLKLSSLLLQMHYLCFSFTAEYYILPTTIPNQKQQQRENINIINFTTTYSTSTYIHKTSTHT